MDKKRFSLLRISIITLAVSLVLNLGISLTGKVFAEDKPYVPGGQLQYDKDRAQILGAFKNKDNSAIGLAQSFLALNPQDVDVLSGLGEAYMNKNDLGLAEATLKKATAIKPNDPVANKLLSRLYMLKAITNLDNFDLAIKQTDRAIALNPDDTVSLTKNKIAIYSAEVKKSTSRGDIQKANEDLDTLISLSQEPDKSKFISMKEVLNRPAPPNNSKKETPKFVPPDNSKSGLKLK